MLLTIHNLPSNTGYSDVKKLLQETCNITELVLDNLVKEGKTKRVTVGLANAADAALVLQRIHGKYVGTMKLYVEDRSNTKNANSFSSTSFNQQTIQPPDNRMGYGPSGINPMVMNSYMSGMPAPGWGQYMSYMGYGGGPQQPTGPVPTNTKSVANQGQGNARVTASDMFQQQNTNLHPPAETPSTQSETSKRGGIRSNRGRAAIRWRSHETNQGPQLPYQQSVPYGQNQCEPNYTGNQWAAQSSWYTDPTGSEQDWRGHQQSWAGSGQNGSNGFWSYDNFTSNPSKSNFQQGTSYDSGPLQDNTDWSDRRKVNPNKWTNDRFHYVAPNRLGNSEPTPSSSNTSTKAQDSRPNFLKRNHPDLQSAYNGNQFANDGFPPKRNKNDFNRDYSWGTGRPEGQDSMQGSSLPFIKGDSFRSVKVKVKPPKPKRPKKNKKQARHDLATSILNKRAQAGLAIPEIKTNKNSDEAESQTMKPQFVNKLNKDETVRGMATAELAARIKSSLPGMKGKTMRKMLFERLKLFIRPLVDELLAKELCKDVTTVMEMYTTKYPNKENRPVYEEIRNKCLAEAPKPETQEGDNGPQKSSPPPLTDKQKIKEEKRQRILEYSKDDLYSLDPVTQKVLNEELAVLANIFTAECQDPEDNLEESVCRRLTERSLKEFNQAVRIHTTKRVLKVETGLCVRIFSSGKLPKRTVLREYLRVNGYGIDRMTLKKNMKGTMFVVNARTFEDYDRLIQLGTDTIEGAQVRFKTMNVTAPPTQISKYQIRQRRKLLMKNIEASDDFETSGNQGSIDDGETMDGEKSEDVVDITDDLTDDVVIIDDNDAQDKDDTNSVNDNAADDSSKDIEANDVEELKDTGVLNSEHVKVVPAACGVQDIDIADVKDGDLEDF